jgi:hypothetical protein
MKSGVARTIPLSTAAVTLLDSIRPVQSTPDTLMCQIACNSDPLFASNIDPSSGTVWSLSTSCIGGTRARSAAPQALRGAKGAGGPCASRG